MGAEAREGRGASAPEEASLARSILALLGGVENLVQLESCMTRLRVLVLDPSEVDVEGLLALDKILAVKSDQSSFQVVLGPGLATRTCKELRSLGVGSQDDGAAGATGTKVGVRVVLEFFSRVFAPLVPVFAGAGLLFGFKQVLVLVFELTGAQVLNPAAVADGGSVLMAALTVLAGTFFTYLNVAIAMSACKNLGGNPYLGLVAGGIVSNVGSLAGVDMGFLGGQFASGRGGALAALAAGALCAVVEREVSKRTPQTLAIHLPSFVTILVVGTATLFVLQPALGLVMDVMTGAIMWVFGHAGPLATMLVSMLWLPMVMLGIHQGLTPVQTELIQTLGYTPLYAAGSMAGAGQVGAALALLLRYRDHERLGKAVRGGLPAAILGIGEPLIYGVSLPLGRVFALACVGASAGGLVLGSFPGTGAVTISVSGVLGALVNTRPLVYLLAYAAAAAAGFALVYVVGATGEDLAAYEASDS